MADRPAGPPTEQEARQAAEQAAAQAAQAGATPDQAQAAAERVLLEYDVTDEAAEKIADKLVTRFEQRGMFDAPEPNQPPAIPGEVPVIPGEAQPPPPVAPEGTLPPPELPPDPLPRRRTIAERFVGRRD